MTGWNQSVSVCRLTAWNPQSWMANTSLFIACLFVSLVFYCIVLVVGIKIFLHRKTEKGGTHWVCDDPLLLQLVNVLSEKVSFFS